MIYLHISSHKVPYFANSKTHWAVLCTKITEGKQKEKIFYWHFNIELAVLNEMVACVMKDQKLEEIIRVAHSAEFEMQFPPSSNHEFETRQNLFCRPTLLISLCYSGFSTLV
jgi:hypothetical protein